MGMAEETLPQAAGEPVRQTRREQEHEEYLAVTQGCGLIPLD